VKDEHQKFGAGKPGGENVVGAQGGFVTGKPALLKGCVSRETNSSAVGFASCVKCGKTIEWVKFEGTLVPIDTAKVWTMVPVLGFDEKVLRYARERGHALHFTTCPEEG